MWQDEVLKKIYNFKRTKRGGVKIPCSLNGRKYDLWLLTADCSSDRMLMETIGRWRKENEMWYLAQFEVSTERTIKWFDDNLTATPDRLLFMIEAEGTCVGHVGLFRFDYANRMCEIDNILRGENCYPGIMGDAIRNMMEWGKRELGLKSYTLQVLSDNGRAIRLYEKMGFKEKARTALIQVPGKDGLEWAHAPRDYRGPVNRYYVHMELSHHND